MNDLYHTVSLLFSLQEVDPLAYLSRQSHNLFWTNGQKLELYRFVQASPAFNFCKIARLYGNVPPMGEDQTLSELSMTK